jgi:RNA polymerase sigma-54 factor
MALEARLQLKQTQKLIMTQMLQQAIKLLPLSRLELVQTIRHELVENPLLEEVLLDEDDSDIPQTDKEEPTDEMEESKQDDIQDEIEWDVFMQDLSEMGLADTDRQEYPSYEATLSSPTNLSDYLLWQLALAAQDSLTKDIGNYLIGNINDEGYLTISVEEAAESLGVDVEQVEKTLSLIQSLDPTGVGSRDLKECLLIQIRQKGLSGTLVEQLVEKYLECLEERHFARIGRALGVSVEEIIQAVKLIKELDPKPGLRHSPESADYIIPDVIVLKIGGDYQVFLNEEGLPRLRVNPYYYGMLRQRDSLNPETRKFIEEKFRSALWLIKSIEQRRQTIYKVACSIVKYQREFLDKGTAYLRPLVLRDVAEDIGMHESTVSRVTTNKYMHTPQGIYELKYFFHSGIDSLEGNTLSSLTVKEMIKKLIENEDPREPLTDQQIMEHLRKQNIMIARRTVTKYRKELKILQSNRRRRIYSV